MDKATFAYFFIVANGFRISKKEQMTSKQLCLLSLKVVSSDAVMLVVPKSNEIVILRVGLILLANHLRASHFHFGVDVKTLLQVGVVDSRLVFDHLLNKSQ